MKDRGAVIDVPKTPAAAMSISPQITAGYIKINLVKKKNDKNVEKAFKSRGEKLQIRYLYTLGK